MPMASHQAASAPRPQGRGIVQRETSKLKEGTTMSALGQKQTFALQKAMSALPPIATSIAFQKQGAPIQAFELKSASLDGSIPALLRPLFKAQWFCHLGCDGRHGRHRRQPPLASSNVHHR